MFIVALITIIPNWTQIKCPSMFDWIKNYGTLLNITKE